MLLYHILVLYTKKYKNVIQKSYLKDQLLCGMINLNCLIQFAWYSVLDTQDLFEYIITIHENVTDNPPIRIYVIKYQF